ncbi:MAG: hypothetical protein J7L45_03155, partial [Candidatus Aenigmarchaeota archaeon]|nr:hypothetical protein [Candidatus Aenigmarchaeota archaeon]
LLGTFIQMPWRNSTGFCMDKYSYSLLGFEAKRLNYFQRLYERTKDPDYLHWVKRLEILFLNKNLYTRKDDGIVWYNTTHFDGKKLRGFFYLDIGYEGYPPGQATISYNIAEYLKSNKNSKLKKILRENLEYILKTQNDDGSWYSALPSGKLKKRAWEISEGSTGSCVRALLKGYEIFKDKRYLEASVKALNFLDRKNIICKNVLRDISINEPEAFSAIVVLDAFLDAFGILKKNKYLKLAERYAKHLLGWIYWHDDFRGFFHPISETISPRISPYETLLLIKTFKRLSKITGEMFWSEIADYLFSKIIDLVDDNYALPEGIFPKMDGSFQYLPMDQTFVTTELLEVLSMYGEYSYKRPKKRRLNIAEKNGYLNLENVVRINTNKFEIYLRGKKLRIDFYSPYDRLSEIKTKLSKMLRILGFLNSARDIKYLVRGVEPPRKSTGSLNSLESYIRSFNINKKEDEVMINVGTRIYDVQINFYRTDHLKMSIKILTKDHDLICDKVLINGKDFTLSSNWTNGGVFKKEFDV